MKQNNYFDKSDRSLWEALQWQPSYQQIDQFVKLQILLRELNTRLNLTRLIEGEHYWISQVFDSLWPLKDELKNPLRLRECVDIGAGCGFPGIAIAIALPKSKMTLIDSSSRKTKALKTIITELGLDRRIVVRTERAEITGQNSNFRGKFDLAMARAVGRVSEVAEYLIPLIKSNGEALIYQGHWRQQDLQELNTALIPLHGTISKIDKTDLPGERGIRHQIRLKAINHCPEKYPRAVGIPKKRPLGHLKR